MSKGKNKGAGRGGRPDGGWTPLQRGSNIPWTEAKRDAFRDELMTAFPDLDPMEVEDFLVRQEAEKLADEVWLNHLVVCSVERREDGSVACISIRRTDRKALRDWRVFQQVKNELSGYDQEAVELFPADDRLVDTANQYWLWVLPVGERFPFGFPTRVVTDEIGKPGGSGARQRPFHQGPVTK